MSYFTLKTIHILSMVLLFGTGLGSAYYKWRADQSGLLEHIAATTRQVVVADWVFTTPTVIIQPISGLLLANMLNIPWTTPWLLTSLALYALAGACWLPVVVLQIKMRDMADLAVQSQTDLPAQYFKMARMWFWLGVPAFLSMIAVVYLMINKPL